MKALTLRVELLGRLISTVALLCVSAFCVFGFLASFEPGNGLLWKVGYGVLGCGCLTSAIRLLLWRRDNKAPPAIKLGRCMIAGMGLFFLAVVLLFIYAIHRTPG
jgi:Na+/proline symporter